MVVERLVELTGLRDRDVLDTTLVSVVADLLPVRSASIFRPIGEGSERRWLARARLDGSGEPACGDSVWTEFDALPALEQHPERLACLETCNVLARSGGAGVEATTFFPLQADGVAVAVLEIETAGPLDDVHRRLVEGVLRIVGNVQGLLDYGERDTLTGLLNRKTFDESFMRMTAEAPAGDADGGGERRADGAGRRPMLGVIDIDHFKRINDGYGHLIGDEVLLLLARLMQSTFRHHDRLFRFGGEEFVVLMHGADDAGAMRAFERLRAGVERYEFPRVGHITISIGVAEVRPDDTPSTCFGRADRAVYYAKANGRNQVASFAALVADGRLDDDSAPSDAGIELF